METLSNLVARAARVATETFGSDASPRKVIQQSRQSVETKPAGAWVQVVPNEIVSHLNIAILLLIGTEKEEVAAAVKPAKKISTSGKPLPHFAEDPYVVVVGKRGGKHGIKNEVWAGRNPRHIPVDEKKFGQQEKMCVHTLVLW
jgi:hypothetical protein